METMINIILTATSVYLLCGFVFAIVFVIKGIAVADEGATGAGIGFRIIIIPGVMVFWLFLLRKWILANKKKRMNPAAE